MTPRAEPVPAAAETGRGGAARVAAGILSSRIVGFLRDRTIAYYFGVGPHADVFATALRGPNILQNLLGEGTVSASFIPIYSRLIEAGDDREARRFAGAIFGLLTAAAAAVALAGVLLARPVVAALAPGFLADAAAVAAGTASVDRFELAVTAVRLIFPMTGILVVSAWALGVLNSHRRFLLSYAAPVAWNTAIIAALVWTGVRLADPTSASALDRLLIAACVGALVGGALQLAVQLPLVLRLLGGLRPSLSTRVPGVRQALAAFGPVVAGRGVVQISAYLDLVLASLLAPGAVIALGYAQRLYILPISLFGMSVAAAELPELSRGTPDAGSVRVVRGLVHTAFVSVPTAIGYLGFGLLLVGTIYRTGSFSAADGWLVAMVLAGYSLGLPAAIWSRLLQSAYFAVSDTRTPAAVAAIRVAAASALAVPLMFALDRVALAELIGGASRLRIGATGLALAAGAAAWLELVLLWRRLVRRLPELRFPLGPVACMAALAGAAGLAAASLWWLLPSLHVALQAGIVVGSYAACYLLGSAWFGIEGSEPWLAAAARLVRRR